MAYLFADVVAPVLAPFLGLDPTLPRLEVPVHMRRLLLLSLRVRREAPPALRALNSEVRIQRLKHKGAPMSRSVKPFHFTMFLGTRGEDLGPPDFTHGTWREFRSHDISLGSAGGVAFMGVSAFMMTGGNDASADSTVLGAGAGAGAGAAGGGGGGAPAPIMPRCLSCCIIDMGSEGGGAAGAGATEGGVGVGTAGVGVVFRDGSVCCFCCCCANKAARAPFPSIESTVRLPWPGTGVGVALEGGGG